MGKNCNNEKIFSEVRGYDETFQGWGWEERDFAKRILKHLDLRDVKFEKHDSNFIEHEPTFHRPKRSNLTNRSRSDQNMIHKRYVVNQDIDFGSVNDLKIVGDGTVMKSPFDFFDEIYCINLERRTDRWKQCKSEFDKIGITDKVIRFNAFDNKENPKKGCYDSHLSVIKLANERKLKNVLIFEDDVAFLKRYDDRKLNKAIENLDKTNWEFFYLGGLERRMNQDQHIII